MQDKISQFFLKWNGIGCDFDGAYGFQCMDVYQQYNKEVTGATITPSNAIDVINKYDKNTYDFIPNSPSNFPSCGDVVLWTNGIGQYGHISVCWFADSLHFVSFDQNFPVGSLCHFQSHNYTNIAGWLHPKALTPVPVPTPVPTYKTRFTFVEPYGDLELQQVESMLIAKDKLINDQIQTIGSQAIIVTTIQKDNESIKSELTTLKQTASTPTIIKVPEASHVPTWLRRIFGDSV